jgi:hypothetical protein
MPLLAEGWEVGDAAYYDTYAFWELNGSIVDTRFVHKDANGFGGNYSMRVSSDFGIASPPLPGTPRWAHCWVFITDTDFNNGLTIQFREYEPRDHITIRIEETGFIQIRRGNNGTLLATSASALDLAVGHWFAIEVVVANAGGIVNVYIDDDPTVFVTYTGDTQNGGNPLWDQFGFGKVAFVVNAFIDDIIITDVTEGQLSETYGRGLALTSDASVALTPSAGSDNWKNVAAVDTSTYNTGITGPLVDLYGVEGNLTLGTVNCVTMQGVAAFQNNFTMQTQLKSGSTTASGSNQTGTAEFIPLPKTIHETDPDTATTWTADAVRALQVGVQAGT